MGRFPKIFIAALLPSIFAAKLDQTYLPPPSAYSSGGNGNFLSAPNQPVNANAYGYRRNAVPILRYNSQNPGDGSYRFEYETENGIGHRESGALRNAGTDREANAVTGSYSYTGPDGNVYAVEYAADENGFRASGAHIPTPPPVPEAILRSLNRNNGGVKFNNGGYKY